jgi:predicted Ser/Thr protein kinase
METSTDFGAYRQEGLLSDKGTHGKVYKATKDNSHFAIKVAKKPDSKSFLREIEAYTVLKQKNLI